jgi:hypothetical protein
MSDTTTTSSRNAGSGRRRSRGGRNRRNRNNNQQGNRNNRSNRGNRNRRPPKPEPLTWWQKLLKAIGLYTPPSQSKGRSASKQAPKSNTRVAKPASEPTEEKPKSPPRPQEVTTPRLYVGNLSYDATETDLEELFKGFGSVKSVEIVYNRRTHRSKGYAFVAMHHINDAKRAVEVLHDQPFMGRKLIVNGAVSSGQAKQRNEEETDETTAPEESEDRPGSSTRRQQSIQPKAPAGPAPAGVILFRLGRRRHKPIVGDDERGR